MKCRLELAVTNVHFTCNESWYCEKNGLAMGSSLAVIWANVWMKFWVPHLKLQTPKCKTNTQFSICRNCEHRVTTHFRGLSVKFAIGGSALNVSKSVTQNMIEWKTSSACVHSAVKMIRLTLFNRPKPSFFYDMSTIL